METYNVKINLGQNTESGKIMIIFLNLMLACVILFIAIVLLICSPLLLIIFICVLPFIKLLILLLVDKGYKNDTFIIYDNFDINIISPSISQINFNLIGCYRNNQVKIINYEFSNRVKILVNNNYGNNLAIISNNKQANERLLYRFLSTGLKVENVCDFWVW